MFHNRYEDAALPGVHEKIRYRLRLLPVITPD